MTQERTELSRPIVETVTLPDKRIIDVVKFPDQPVITIEYPDTETLLNPKSESFKIFEESMLRSRPFILKTEGTDSIGTNTNHLDANRQLFEKLSTLLNRNYENQGQSTENLFSPELIQQRIDVGQMMTQYPEHAGLINSLTTKTSTTVDQLFSQAMKDTPRSENPVVISGLANIDAICILDQQSAQTTIDRALTYVFNQGRKQGKTKSQITREIENYANGENIDISGKIENMAQLVGYVLRSFNEAGGKPQVTSKKLLDKITKIFKPSIYKLGGAASQMANLLDGDGENVAIITPYQSEKQSSAYTNNPSLIRPTKDGYSISKVKDKEGQQLDDPEKINIPIEHQKGVEIKFNGKTYIAQKADRTIVKSPGYYDKEGNLIDPEPTFNCSDEALEKLAKDTPVFILNNLHNVQSYTPEKYQQVMSTLIRQIGIIRKAGAKVAIEISGSTDNVSYLEDFKGLIDYISLNGKELGSISKNLAAEQPEIKILPFKDGYKDSFSVFQNALVLQKILQAEVVNVHETWADASPIYASSKEELNRKTLANLHSKLKVYGHLMGLTPQDMINGGNLSASLSVEGKLEVMKFATKYAKSLNISQEKEEQVIYEIMTTLSYFNPNGVSVSLAPSKGLNGAKNIISTGAGDRTGSVAINEFYKHLKTEQNPTPTPPRYNLSQFLRDTKNLAA